MLNFGKVQCVVTKMHFCRILMQLVTESSSAKMQIFFEGSPFPLFFRCHQHGIDENSLSQMAFLIVLALIFRAI